MAKTKIEKPADHQVIVNRFEAIVGELHSHTEKMIVTEGLDMSVKTKAATLNSWLELNLPEFFQENK